MGKRLGDLADWGSLIAIYSVVCRENVVAVSCVYWQWRARKGGERRANLVFGWRDVVRFQAEVNVEYKCGGEVGARLCVCVCTVADSLVWIVCV